MERFDFTNQVNADYIDRLYEQYQRDPRSLDPTWQAYFAGFEFAGGRGIAPAAADSPGSRPSPLTIGVHNLVHSYRELGHFVSRLDPLSHDRPHHPLLDLSQFSMTDADLDRQVGKGTFVGRTDGTLRDLVAKLRQTYCGTIGVEFTNISEKAQRDWLAQRMEPILNRPAFTTEESRAPVPARRRRRI